MTDNRTTELTATERICEQLEAAGVSFVRSEQIIEGTYWGVTWFVGETKFEFRENDKRTDLIVFNATPEQAIAATLGSTLTAEQVRESIESRFDFDVWVPNERWQAIADELNAALGRDETGYYDRVYIEKIEPRVMLDGVPTKDIRKWSVFAHSVMELSGPAPFGEDGNVYLWLHEKSLTRLLDMCDVIDDKFATLGRGICHWEYQQDENGFTGIVKCSNCGHQFSASAAIVDEWKCCPVCKAVVE